MERTSVGNVLCVTFAFFVAQGTTKNTKEIGPGGRDRFELMGCK